MRWNKNHGRRLPDLITNNSLASCTMTGASPPGRPGCPSLV